MKKTILRYGLYSAVTICILFLLSWTLGKDLDYGTQEVLGYASMIVSLSFVYFGIRHFRDRQNGGKISLGKGLLVGILISLCAALAFGLIDLIYIEFLNPDFLTDYYERSVETLRASLPQEQFETEFAKMEKDKALYTSPVFTFFLMFLTVFVIGFIMSLISALILQRKS